MYFFIFIGNTVTKTVIKIYKTFNKIRYAFSNLLLINFNSIIILPNNC